MFAEWRMKMFKTALLSAVATLVIFVSNANAGWTCKVTDPTGTHLNVRSEPNSASKVVRTLKNGMTVLIGEVSKDGRWAEVIPVVPGRKMKVDENDWPMFDGWAFMPFLDNGKCLPVDYPISK
jgi:Bacterial SH3 domain